MNGRNRRNIYNSRTSQQAMTPELFKQCHSFFLATQGGNGPKGEMKIMKERNFKKNVKIEFLRALFFQMSFRVFLNGSSIAYYGTATSRGKVT